MTTLITNSYSTRYIQQPNNFQKHNITFKNYVLRPKYRSETIWQKINPCYIFINNMLKHSILASRRSWVAPINELKNMIKVIELQSKNTTNTIWDINDGTKHKYIIILHGLAHNISKLQALYKEILEKTPYAVLAPEYRDMRAVDRERKDFKLSPKTIHEDINLALTYLNNKGVKNNNIAVLGHSFGSYPATQLAVEHPDLEKLILVSPIDSFKHWGKLIKNGYTKRIPKSILFFIKNFEFIRNQLNYIYQVSKYLKRTPVHTDIVHSCNDRRVDISSSQQLASICQNLGSLRTPEKGGHKMESYKINEIIQLLCSERS